MSDYAYISRHEVCGAIDFAIVDNPEEKRTVANKVAKLIREGRPCERVPLAEAASGPWCKCAAIAAEKDPDAS